jgi:ABC-2 type transport system permease protein
VSTAVLYSTLLRRSLIEFRRYAFDTISGLISIYGFFLVIFFGAKIFGGDQAGFGESIEGVVVSYGMWAITMFALGSLTYDLTQEAQLGTLEQLGMSPFGLVRVLVARAFTSLATYVAMWVALLVVMMATTGRWLHIDVISIVPLLAVTIVGVIGVGFLLAGLAIVFKRVQQMLQIHQVLSSGSWSSLPTTSRS